jgi:hypothetical protein
MQSSPSNTPKVYIVDANGNVTEQRPILPQVEVPIFRQVKVEVVTRRLSIAESIWRALPFSSVVDHLIGRWS